LNKFIGLFDNSLSPDVTIGCVGYALNTGYNQLSMTYLI